MICLLTACRCHAQERHGQVVAMHRSAMGKWWPHEAIRQPQCACTAAQQASVGAAAQLVNRL
jgi:hypothetical protein